MPWQATFGEVEPGAALLYEDADYGGLGIALQPGLGGRAARSRLDTPVRIEPA